MASENFEAERSLLGALLVRNDLIPACSLIPAHFGHPSNRRIFSAMQMLYPSPVDLVTLCDFMDGMGELQACGGAEYISDLTTGVPRLTSVAHYEVIIREQATRRGLLRLAEDLKGLASDKSKPLDETLTKCESALRKFSGATGPLLITGSQLKALEEADIVRRKERGQSFAHFGLGGLDHWTRPGLQDGSVWTIGARTSVGKTGLLCQIVTANILKGRKTLFVACEMGVVRMGMRIFAGLAGVSLRDAREVTPLDRDASQRYMIAMDTIASTENFRLLYQPSPTVGQITSALRAARDAMGGLELVVLDYFQKVRPTRHRNGAYEERTQVAQDLVALAGQEGVPFIIGCQLNRNAETDSQNDKPLKSELKGTGSLEEESTGVILLHRWGSNGSGQYVAPGAEIIVAKYQDGPTGTLPADFIFETATWVCD